MTCSIPGCERPYKCKGYCGTHYQRLRLHGDPLYEYVRPPQSPDVVLEKNMRVDEATGCWLWTGGLFDSGYGHWSSKSTGEVRAHRAVWVFKVGPIPDGMTLDHLCEVKRCVNPDHIVLATPRENTLRGDTVSGRNSRKTECIRGHPFTADNTFINSQGHRQCRICNRRRTKKARESA